MIIYRPAKGVFDEAMEEAKEFENDEGMKAYIVENWNALGFGTISVEDLSIGKRFTRDIRNGWQDTRYVLTKRIGGEYYENPQCIGFCARIY